MPLQQITVRDQSGANRIIAVDDNRYAQIGAALRRTALADSIAIGLNARDAGEAMSFVIAQLAYTENEVFERQRTPMQYEQLIPISHEAGEWATSIRYEIYDWVGRGKASSGKGRDINRVDVAWADKSFPVVNGDIGYDYTQEELRQSAFLKRSLDQRRADAAMDGYHRHLNDVGLNGETSRGLTGLFNNANVPVANAPTGNWAGASPANILKDLNTGLIAGWTNTAYNDQISDVVIPPSAYAYIASTPRSDNSDKTILQYLKENNISKLERNVDLKFSAGYGLETAGVGGTRRVLFYVKNPSRLIMHVPMPLRFLAPQMVGLQVDIPGEYKYSGVEWRYVKSAYYMDGV
jgi:hypothetical protein